MTESGLLEHILERLSGADSGEEIFGADEAAQWSGGALDVLIKSGLLGGAEPACVIECDGCERNCFMPVHVRPAEGNRPARAFISCDKPENVGRVPVELPAFDVDTLLPEALRAWIIDDAEWMPCPPGFIAAAALVALGSIVGARCEMRPKARDSWLIVPTLWGGIVGDPSAKKSPAWGAALKPLDRLITEALAAHTAALADYETEKVVFDPHNDSIEGRIKEAAKKPSNGDPASIAKEPRTHGERRTAAQTA